MENKLTAHVSYDIDITQEDLFDILTTAFEGGIGYWCESIEVISKGTDWGNIREEDHEYSAANIAAGGSAELYCSEDMDVPYVLTRDLVISGIERVLSEKLVCYTKDSTEWIGDIDADIADVIVQYALFGMLVYG